jgi:hypothetical protein
VVVEEEEDNIQVALFDVAPGPKDLAQIEMLLQQGWYCTGILVVLWNGRLS